jgi:hypothetical protein
MKGWYEEGYRHSLAARGIKTSLFSKNNSFMAARYRIPHWLLDNLTFEQREEAEKMLFEQNMGVGDVAKYFGVQHPNVGIHQKERVLWSDDQKIDYIKDLAEQLGRPPYMTDIAKLKEAGNDIPSPSSFASSFGTWNAMLERAGLEPNVMLELVTAKQKIETFGIVPSKKEIAGEAVNRWEMKHPEYASERWQELKDDAEAYAAELERHRINYWKDPEAHRLRVREYRQTPEGEAVRKEYREEYNQRPLVKIIDKLDHREARAEEKEIKLMIAEKFGYDPEILDPGYASGEEARKQNAIVDLAYAALKGQVEENKIPEKIEAVPQIEASEPTKIVVKHFEPEPKPESYEAVLKDVGVEKLDFLSKRLER